jgi:hypothetical protein
MTTAAAVMPTNDQKIAAAESTLTAAGGSVIKRPSPLNVLTDAYDHSCYRARSDEYWHLMTDPPAAERTLNSLT